MAVEFWRMGATPVPCTEIGRMAQEFEDAGWDGLAVGEAHGILPDPYAVLALAAAATTKLKVGTAVAVPLRHPLLAADAMATVQGITGGRACFSMGHGDGAVKVLQQAPMSVGDFEVYVRRVQAFLRGEEVDMGGPIVSMARVPMVDYSLDVAKPRIDVAATGPRVIEIAVKWADSVSFAVGADLERLRHCIEIARDACKSSGRDFDALSLGCYVQVAVTDDSDAARARARDAVRGLVITHSRFSGYEGKPLTDVQAADVGQIQHSVDAMDAVMRAGHRSVTRVEGGRPGELNFYPRDAVDDDFVDRFGVIGTAEQCAERLQQVVDLGIDRIYVGTRGVGVDPEEVNTDRIGREVIPLVKSAAPA